MRQGEIWNLVNKIIWSSDKASYEIVIVVRAMPDGERVISGDSVRKLHSNGLIELRDGSLIPLHRVIEIRRAGTVVFSRRSGRKSGRF